MREMLLDQKDMVGLVNEGVTYSGDGDVIIALSENKFIIFHATNLFGDLEVCVTQALEEYHLIDRLVVAGVMSKDELNQERKKREHDWVLARRTGLERQRANLDARIARMEKGA